MSTIASIQADASTSMGVFILCLADVRLAVADILKFPPRYNRPMGEEVADLIDRWRLFDARMDFAEREGLFNPSTVALLEAELAQLQAELERLLQAVQGRRIQ
jgi:hypothetical protein